MQRVSPRRNQWTLALRADVLHTAQHMLTERGYAHLSMDDLAVRSGISKPTLYTLFESKESLVIEAALHALDVFLALVNSTAAHASPFDQIVTVLDTALRLHLYRAMLVSMLWSPDLFGRVTDDAAVRAALTKLDAGLLALVQHAMQRGEIDPNLDAWTVVLLIYAMLASANRRQSHIAVPPSDTALPDALRQLFVQSVQAMRLPTPR